jgi:LCP family protein required for cell wall assembly
LFFAALAILLSACGTSAQAQAQRQVFAPFALITSAPNSSPTPTPFQSSFDTPAPAQILLTETPSPIPTLPLRVATATAEFNQLFPTAAAPPLVNAATQPTVQPSLTANETVNVLLIGSDKRPGLSYRTDTLVVAIIWLKEGQVSLISIPRDLWVYIPTVGMQRINTAYQSGEINGYIGGGAGLLKDTVAYNLGVRIDHTAMVEFDGFRRIVDTLGGIDVPVSCAYTDWRLIDPADDPNDENSWQLYALNPGQAHMDGDLALWYARARSKSNDFERGRRQQEVLRSIFAKALQTDTFSKIPQLYNDFASVVVTDLSLADLLRLSPDAVNFTNANIRSYYIRPPYVSAWITPGGASVLLPNDASLKQMLMEATALSPYAIARKTVTVEVQNGAPFETYDVLAASRLNYAGYQTVVTNAERRDYTHSVIVDFTPRQDAAQRQTIIAALNLNSANVIALPDTNSATQYRVILGYDYEPCFKPQDLAQ